MGEIANLRVLENTFCQQFKDFNAFNDLNRPVFISSICKLTEISMNMSISLGVEKERKWGVKNVDLTKSYIILTDSGDFPASLSEMTLMILGKHGHVFGKS
ncbi:MAG: hypothetical protein LBQ39_00485 [Tannerellaceae bacterium]|jgi:hypothetical protein|nr:hypothetical protein [Tannerellaceae bacterium]